MEGTLLVRLTLETMSNRLGQSYETDSIPGSPAASCTSWTWFSDSSPSPIQERTQRKEEELVGELILYNASITLWLVLTF